MGFISSSFSVVSYLINAVTLVDDFHGMRQGTDCSVIGNTIRYDSIR